MSVLTVFKKDISLFKADERDK